MKYVIKIMLLFVPALYNLNTYTSTKEEPTIPLSNYTPPCAHVPAGWDPQIAYMQTSPHTNPGIAALYTQRFAAHKTADDVAQSWPPLYIAEVNEKVGMGCFARKKIKKHSFIREYTGQRIPATLETDDFTYVAMLTHEIFVDAKNIGNESRYMNHSTTTPNAINDHIRLADGTIILVLIALKDIEPDEEIRWNYGSSYWKEQGKKPD